MADLKFGALCRNQYSDWPGLLEAGRRADRLGYDSLWTWDQLPSSTGTVGGDPTGHASTADICCAHPPLTDWPPTHTLRWKFRDYCRWGLIHCSGSLAESG